MLNVQLKDKSSELHFYEVSEEKERKLEKKLVKDIEIETNKTEEMAAIIEGLHRLREEKEREL